MSGYTKLFGSILASTIWNEPAHVKVVWITMLAMCDRDGLVESSIPGLAVMARIDRALTEQAISLLSSPDPDSRTKTDDGRRIRAVDGGWHVLNYEAYRDKQTAEEQTRKKSERQARWRARMAQKTSTETIVDIVDDERRSETHSEAEAEAEAEAETTTTSPRVVDPRIARLFALWQSVHHHPQAKLTAQRAAKIRARLREGYDETRLAAAIRGVLHSPHHTGQNRDGTVYDDLVTILRDGSQVEKFSALAAGSPTKHVPGKQEALDRKIDQARQNGDWNLVNELEASQWNDS